MNDYLAERLNRTDPKFLDKLTAFEATQLGLLHNILGMQGVLVQQNDILINHFCPAKPPEVKDIVVMEPAST